MGVNVEDRKLLKVVQQYPERLEVAIACLEEKQHRVKHPTRFLQRAIEEAWQPETQPAKKAPEGFPEWMREARRRYLVCASQMVDGVIRVLTACEQWIPYEELCRLSWEELEQKLLGNREQGCAT